MRHLFCAEGDAALAAALARQPLLAFDFDGVLSPIVARPDDARVPLAVARRLDRLSRTLPLAIVSGRSVDDVRARLAFEPSAIVGSHGAESPLAPPEASASVFDGVRARLNEHAAELKAAGVSVEDKQRSIALHYRLARDRERALALVTGVVEGLGPDLHVFSGKLVVNLVSAQAPDKAHSVAGLVRRCGAGSAVFVGNDVDNEAVFASADPAWLTVRVGRACPGSLARFCLDGPGEVASMLDRMLVLLEQSSG